MITETTSPNGKEQAALCSSALLGCPWCGNQPVAFEMKYRNTGNVFGHMIRCDTCNFEKSIAPPGWTQGKEQEAMDEAKENLIKWWNSRKQANASS
jgi:predicted RNA-binding Zn-ribbon protein involved in translation (DUF1610 family)